MSEPLDNPRHEKFSVEYAVSGNAAGAYRRVYGKRTSTENSVRACASRLLTFSNIKARVKALRREYQARQVDKGLLTIEERRRFLANVVRTPIGEVDEDSPLCHSFKKTEATTEYKMGDKLKAIELDAKLAGELTEQVRVSGIGMTLEEFRARVSEARAARK